MDHPTFGELLRLHLADQRRTQPWLVQRIAEITGDRPLDPTMVTKWTKEIYGAPSPPVVFAIEQALELAPGTLSRPLGYLPVDAADALTVPAAVEADSHLSVLGRRVILKVYEELVADGPDGPDA